jgi:hypothetical protein
MKRRRDIWVTSQIGRMGTSLGSKREDNNMSRMEGVARSYHERRSACSG